MYNHQIKKVKFNLFKSDLKKTFLKKDQALVLFFEESTQKTALSTQLKKSFFFKGFSKNFLKQESVAGSGAFFKVSFDLSKNLKDFLSGIKNKPCVIYYNLVYWSLSKILSLSLENNKKESLMLLLLKSLKKSTTLLLPIKYLVSSFKLQSSKQI